MKAVGNHESMARLVIIAAVVKFGMRTLSNPLNSTCSLSCSRQMKGCGNLGFCFSNRFDTAFKEAQSAGTTMTAPDCWQANELAKRQVYRRRRLPSPGPCLPSLEERPAEDAVSGVEGREGVRRFLFVRNFVE